MRPSDDIEKLVSELHVSASAQLDERVHSEIDRALAESKQRQSAVRPNLARIIMRNPITKLAAAAVIVVGAIAAFYFLGGEGTKTCCAWDQIIQPILNARTAEFDIVIGEEGAAPVIHDMVMGSHIRRTVEGMPTVSIIDLNDFRILSLVPAAKQATIVELKGLPNIPDYMDRLRNLVAKVEEDPNFTLEELGEQDVEGQFLYGFKAKHPRLELTIWTDPATALPVRIEQQEGRLKITCKNMQFDVPMDESLFSMDVPDGYTVGQMQMSAEASEDEFIEMLRIQAEVLGDGVFPDDVSVEYFIKHAAATGTKLGLLNLSQEERKQISEKLAQGLMFIRFFKGEGNWHYAGKGVKLGDAQTPIFWYQPKDSQEWRVIYGDLRTETVTAEKLAELENALPQ